jgi:uncharacterized protein YbjT (DUF2867 family)
MVGRHVVAALRRQGDDPVVLARSTGVDVASGRGLSAALAGAEVLIDVTNPDVAGRKGPATAFFTASTRQLVDAGRAAGVRHHVALSIVGIDRISFGYYQAKLRQEQLLLASGAPVSVLRATQFHEFAGQYLDRVHGPVVPVLAFRSQPVAAGEVAAALADLAAGDPVGMAPEIAGPQEERLIDMVRRLLSATHRRKLVVEVTPPTAWGRAYAAGAALPAAPGRRGTLTFDDWLATRTSPAA